MLGGLPGFGHGRWKRGPKRKVVRVGGGGGGLEGVTHVAVDRMGVQPGGYVLLPSPPLTCDRAWNRTDSRYRRYVCWPALTAALIDSR